MIKQIGLPLRGRPILLIARMITDRIGLHSVLLPLLIRPDFWTDLNDCRQRLLFVRQITQRKCSLCSQGRLLGMTVNEKLTWTPHMLKLKKSFAKKLGLLKKSRFLLGSVRHAGSLF